jgi:hypothetical protein
VLVLHLTMMSCHISSCRKLVNIFNCSYILFSILILNVFLTLFNRWLGVQLNPHFMGVDLKYVTNLLLHNIWVLWIQIFKLEQVCLEFCFWVDW